MKHLRVASLLERRIQKGDYALSGIPAERDLAEEIGTSRVTLRKALEELTSRGLLTRAPNRRLVISPEASPETSGVQIAFVSPSIAPSSFSPDLQLWLASIDDVTRKRRARVKTINYHHWDDPALSEAIRTFDGVFLVTNSEPMPSWTSKMLSDAQGVVALSEDLSHLNIPSIVLFPPLLIESMMKRLQQLGHRRIDCINIQGHNTITQARIDAWSDWLRNEEVGGKLIDEPCDVDKNIFEAGLEVARRWIKKIDKRTTAVLCVTLPAAMGVIRAASESGVTIGNQLSVCTIDCEGIGKFMNPAIASFERPDPKDYVNSCIDWFKGNGTAANWKGPLLMEPSRLKIVDGGSIGPAPSRHGK